jgi:translation initiation factor 5
MPKKPRGGTGKGKKARQIPLVLLASARVASPQRLPINPDAGAAGRYKMPQLVCIPTGKGKNTRVVLDNLDDVAASLQRPPAYITHYISYAAGVGKTRPEGGSQGGGGSSAHSLSVEPSRIEGLLQSFIEEWVLCMGCALPECDLLVEEDASILPKCSACGHCVRSHHLPSSSASNPYSARWICA